MVFTKTQLRRLFLQETRSIDLARFRGAKSRIRGGACEAPRTMSADGPRQAFGVQHGEDVRLLDRAVYPFPRNSAPEYVGCGRGGSLSLSLCRRRAGCGL